MRYLNTRTREYPLSEFDIKQRNPNISFPSDFSNLPEDYVSVKYSPSPPFNSMAEFPEEDSPIEINGEWVQAWKIVPLSEEVIQKNLLQKSQELKADIVNSTQERLDSFARTRNYDGILSACTYATSNVPKFSREGQAAVNLRDATWAALYQILEEVQTGKRNAPMGFQDIEADLPALEWPV